MLLPRSLARLGWWTLLVGAGLAVGVGPAQAQHFGRNKIQYERFDWHVLRTDHFDVYYYPEMEALAEIGAAFAEEAYPEMENRFAFSLTERVPLIFYSSNLHFKQTNVTPGFIPDGVGGFFEFLKGRVVVPSDGNLHHFRRVVRHELAHVFTFNKLARVLRDHRRPVDRVLPLWFTEGLAEHWSGEPDYQHEMILRDAVASNTLVALDDLDRIAGTFTMYKEGEAFCRFVAEEWGEERLLDLIENSWRDVDFRKVLAFVLREDFRAISDRFDAWLRAQYLPPLAEADVPSLVAEPIATRGFSFKPAVHTFPDGRREVVYVGNEGGYVNLFAQPVDADWAPTGRREVLVRGERSEDFESFHLFESRMDVSTEGLLTFVTKRGGQDVVHVYDLRARRRAGLYRFDDLVAVYSPTWSPDGRRLAFTGIDRGGTSDLYLYERGDGALHRLTHDAYDDRNAAWSPDGTRLAFSSDRTAYGEEGAYNLFTLDLSTGEIAYVTSGPQMDLSPRWSPDGTRLVFVSSRREPDGHFSAQDLWVADLAPSPVATEATTSLPPAAGTTGSRADHGPREASGDSSVSAAGAPPVGPTLHRLTAFTGAAFDPVWTADDHVVFSTFEDYRFTVRTLSLDSLLADPHPQVAVRFPAPDSAWAFNRLEITDAERRRPYRRRYTLDIAAGNINNSPAYGASGGAVVAFSDVLGDDIFYVTAYSANTVGRSFLEGLSLGVTRIHLGRRANYGYGLFRMAGQRYDRTDPDAVASYPVYYEQVYGAVGLMEYPLTKFRRIELSTSIGWSRKDQLLRVDDELETVQFTNSLALVHDNALYGLNGPLDGWRASVAAGYSTDLLYSNVSFYSVSADVRRYFRITRDVTFASWGLGRFNVGRRARLNLLGGSWSLRGFPFLRLRGRNLWFTSHELRFPLVNNPSAVVPLLAPFGVVSLRGALFADAARLWNEGYDDVELDPGSGYHVGTTLGAVGAGLRLNLYGAFVLRYDRGYRFTDGLRWAEREPFSQFFFGWDF